MTEENILQTYIKNTPEHEIIDIEGVPHVVHKNDVQVKDFEELLPNPTRTKETERFDDLRGFVDYTNDFSSESTVGFVGDNRIEVIFDYHTKEKAAWCTHIAIFNLKENARWAKWSGYNDTWIEQREFADLLDSGIEEIVEPVQSEIIDLVKNFRATLNQEVVSGETEGGTNFSYNKEVRGGHKKTDVKLPNQIEVCIRPFDGIDALNEGLEEKDQVSYYKLRVSLAFRIIERDGEARVHFKYKLLGFDKAYDETLETLKKALKEKLNVKKLYTC